MPSPKMTSEERRSVCALASVMSLRLLGLFMILPVLTLYAHALPGATPLMIGLSMGIYGLTQGAFQIPFGMLSDKWGRKPIITAGLLIFAAGSLICALSQQIETLVIGRALQGAGAVGSTIIAMIADLTREEQRTKAMALNGMTIGMSFSVAMMVGPLLAAWIHVTGIFWLAIAFSAVAILILYTIVPTPLHAAKHNTALSWAQFLLIAKDRQLARLNIGIFMLHAIFAASFVAIPISLQKVAGLPGSHQWYLYVPIFIIAFGISILMIITAEKKRQLKEFFVTGILMLGAAELCLSLWASSLLLSGLSLLVFFTAFSLLEACLPSWVSRAAPKTLKGTALGIYSCSQYLGFFVGGALGGYLYGMFGLREIYLLCLLLALVWLAIAFGMKNPHYSTSHPTNSPPRMGEI